MSNNEDRKLTKTEYFDLRERRLKLVYKILYVVVAIWIAVLLSVAQNTLEKTVVPIYSFMLSASSMVLGGGEAETKTDQAEDLILDMLSSGEFVPAEKIFEKAKERNISQRTVNEAKLKNKSIVTKKIGKRWFWAIPDSAEETA